LRFLKRSTRKQPRVSLVVLDWSVRESFHLLHYLKTQSIPRDDYEVIVVEYYDCVSDAVAKFETEVDTWVLLEMPDDCYYHKHLMYNTGIVVSRGEIVMFGDSDAMVRPAFVEAIVGAFERDPRIVYHMDEFRNVRRDFYPFNFPSFEDVLGDGCINNIDGKTKGIRDNLDPIHTRNYGACMCAWRKDLLAIGGADEDMTYLGHICGPYDMTFRLMNSGLRVHWEQDEYLYHTWHPGSDGAHNYLGPHDGRNMSTTALRALCSGRVPPLVENEAIRRLRTGSEQNGSAEDVEEALIDPAYVEKFSRLKLGEPVMRPEAPAAGTRPTFASYHGYDVYRNDGSFYAIPEQVREFDFLVRAWREDDRVIAGGSFAEIRDTLDSLEARLAETVGACNICELGGRFAVVPHELGLIDFRLRSHRENPRIAWFDNLDEARGKADEVTLAQAKRDHRAPAVHPSGLVANLQPTAWDMADLERRIGAVETHIAGIYKSRTWRALTALGSVFPGAARMPRPRKEVSGNPPGH
jgi:hypothetical protein